MYVCDAESQDLIVHFSCLQIVKTEGSQKVMAKCWALGGVCNRFARGSSAPWSSRPCRHLMLRSSRWMWRHQLHPPLPSVSFDSGQTWERNEEIIKTRSIFPYTKLPLSTVSVCWRSSHILSFVISSSSQMLFHIFTLFLSCIIIVWPA